MKLQIFWNVILRNKNLRLYNCLQFLGQFAILESYKIEIIYGLFRAGLEVSKLLSKNGHLNQLISDLLF
jgi:hypothetical protein